MACPLCQKRNEKRPCPGIGRSICSVCCGTKRLVEIANPTQKIIESLTNLNLPAGVDIEIKMV